MSTTLHTQEVQGPISALSLSDSEIALIMDYRGLHDVDRNALAIFAKVRRKENPRTPALKLVKGGA